MKVAAAGDNCVDVYEKEGQSYPGGNPVNVAVYLKRMGVDASFTSVVGDDQWGTRMADALTGKGVDISHLHVEHGDTAVTMVEIVNGNRVFGDYIEGVMERFQLSDEDVAFICTHDLFVSGIWGHCDNRLKDIHDAGIPVVFDYSDQPQDPIVDATLAYVDYAFFGLESDDNEDVRAFMVEKQAKGPKVVIVTLGENGSLAYDGAQFHKGDIVKCEVVDTMGAGDSFIAGFIVGILEGQTIDECMVTGAKSSAVTLGYSGAW